MGEAGIFTDRVDLLDGEILGGPLVSVLRPSGEGAAVRPGQHSRMWLVGVEARAVTVYTGPGPEAYAGEQVLDGGDMLAATGVELGFPVAEIFG